MLVCATGNDSLGEYVGSYPFEVETDDPCIAKADEIIIEGEDADLLIQKMRKAGYILDNIPRLRRRILMASYVPQVVQEIREWANFAGLKLSDYISDKELDAIVAEAKSRAR